MSSLLSVTDLHVRYVESGREAIRAVNGVSCEVRPGEILAILGESGCGKSTFAKSLLGMSPKNAVVHGSIKFAGLSLLTLSDADLRDIRGARIARIPQEPGLALNPVIKVGDQIAEILRAHRSCSWKECQTEATKLLDQVQLSESGRDMYNAFPHQLSGGQQQRVAIAQSIACRPALIIADEPTTALDPATEMDILRLLKNLKAKWNMSLILITHNPMILPGLADRVAVMYGGRIVEEGSIDGVFHTPRHPYTQALLQCARLAPAATGERTRFPQIPGSAPDAGAAPAGCVFAPRCSRRVVRCDTEQPQMIQAPDERRVECFLYV